jgi:xanthine dehydrogenase YagR molybdenum-binding subunit
VKVTYAEEPAIASLKDALFRGETAHKPPSDTFTHGKDGAVLNIPTAEEPPPGTFAHGGDATRGNVEQGLAEAAIQIDQTYVTQVIHHNPMELSATTAVWEGEHLTLYDATQWIYGDRNAVATMLGIPQEQVRVISHFVGGGFGCKCFTWSHVILAAIAAKQVGRPVKVVLTREQMFMSVGYRASSSQRIQLGAKQDGTLTAISHEGIVQTSTFANYPTPVGLLTPMVYACPNLLVKHYLMHVNAGTPTQMRAPGEAPGMFALESAMDELAYVLDIDPIALRLRNYADADPQSGKPWSSKSLKECYQQGAERFGWEKRTPKPGSMQDGDFLVGWGMATAAYPVYLSPAAARVKIFTDGHAVAQSGSHEIGNGTYTVMTQLAAEALGLSPEKVQFELGDTNLPNTPITGASRTVGSVDPQCKRLPELPGVKWCKWRSLILLPHSMV